MIIFCTLTNTTPLLYSLAHPCSTQLTAGSFPADEKTLLLQIDGGDAGRSGVNMPAILARIGVEYALIFSFVDIVSHTVEATIKVEKIMQMEMVMVRYKMWVR